MIEEAFAAATSGRPGPVHLTLPLDVQTADVDLTQVVRSPKRSGAVSLNAPGDPRLIAEATNWLGEAELTCRLSSDHRLLENSASRHG